MRELKSGLVALADQEQLGTKLDLVVPFTTPTLTLAALDAANRLGAGLQAGIRLLKIQVVPYPMDLAQSPVPLEFLKEQLRRLPSAIPAECEVRLAREFDVALAGVLGAHSLVVLATRKRPWRTRQERLAASLRRAGHTVVLVPEGKTNNA